MRSLRHLVGLVVPLLIAVLSVALAPPNALAHAIAASEVVAVDAPIAQNAVTVDVAFDVAFDVFATADSGTDVSCSHVTLVGGAGAPTPRMTNPVPARSSVHRPRAQDNAVTSSTSPLEPPHPRQRL